MVFVYDSDDLRSESIDVRDCSYPRGHAGTKNDRALPLRVGGEIVELLLDYASDWG
jgi:hypothetical protein